MRGSSDMMPCLWFAAVEWPVCWRYKTVSVEVEIKYSVIRCSWSRSRQTHGPGTATGRSFIVPSQNNHHLIIITVSLQSQGSPSNNRFPSNPPPWCCMSSCRTGRGREGVHLERKRVSCISSEHTLFPFTYIKLSSTL